MEEQGLECRLDKPEDHDKNKAVDTDHVTITGHEFYEEKEFEPAPGIGLLPRAFYTSILTGIGATIGYLSGGDLISAAQIGMSFLGGSGLLFVRGTSDKCLVDLAVDYGLAFPYHKLETTVVKAVTSFDQVKVRTHYSQQGILEDLHGLFKEYSDRVAQIPATIEEAYEIKHPNKTPHLTINMARQSLESYESREFVKAVEDSREMRKRLRTGKPATPF